MNVKRIILIVVFTLIANAFFAQRLLAYVMSSSNYQIRSDSLTIGGGGGSSANYNTRTIVGELSSGWSEGASYKMRAGYQEMLETYISVSSPGVLAMSPDMPGISGGTSDVSGTFTVIADSYAGFSMSLAASTAHTMIKDDDPTYYFTNYQATPTYTWTVYSGNSMFGFTIEPETSADTTTAFRDDGSNTCGTGSYNGTGTCWAGFDGTDAVSVINRSTRTDIDGENEVIKFRAQSYDNPLASGTYSATITATVSSN